MRGLKAVFCGTCFGPSSNWRAFEINNSQKLTRLLVVANGTISNLHGNDRCGDAVHDEDGTTDA
jgi:hypothetical protein